MTYCYVFTSEGKLLGADTNIKAIQNYLLGFLGEGSEYIGFTECNPNSNSPNILGTMEFKKVSMGETEFKKFDLYKLDFINSEI